jgi:hypothetical protein
MSQLFLQTNDGKQFALNVESFRSPIFTTFNGAQTKTQYQWFPLKVNQPELEFNVQFASEFDYEAFQIYVRNSQVSSLAMTTGTPQVTLYWPQRNINNWSGYIRSFKAGGRRANYAPRATFTVDLATSLVSTLAHSASFGVLFSIINGLGLSTPGSNQTDNAISSPSSSGITGSQRGLGLGGGLGGGIGSGLGGGGLGGVLGGLGGGLGGFGGLLGGI